MINCSFQCVIPVIFPSNSRAYMLWGIFCLVKTACFSIEMPSGHWQTSIKTPAGFYQLKMVAAVMELLTQKVSSTETTGMQAH